MFSTILKILFSTILKILFSTILKILFWTILKILFSTMLKILFSTILKMLCSSSSCLSVCLYVYGCQYLSFCLPACLPACLPTCLSSLFFISVILVATLVFLYMTNATKTTTIWMNWSYLLSLQIQNTVTMHLEQPTLSLELTQIIFSLYQYYF